MDKKLTEWINEELSRRGWSYRELARRASVSHTTVTDIANGQRQPTWEACVAIADVLGKSPEEVFRMAGLLPPLPAIAHEEEEFLYLLRQLTTQERQSVLRMLRGLLSQPVNAIIPTSRDAVAIYSGEIERLINVIIGADEIGKLFNLLDGIRQVQVYEFVLYQLRIQALAYNSSGQTEKAEEWGKVIELIDLLLAVHRATPDKRKEIITSLWILLEELRSGRDTDLGGRSLPPGAKM